MLTRRAIVGCVTVAATLIMPAPASALTCVWPPIEDAALAADSVIEATIAARHSVHQVLNGILAWFDHATSSRFDHYELVLDDVRVLRGSRARVLQTQYEYLAPGGRYVFIAKRRWFGPLSVSLCRGYAIEAEKAAELKAWLASLPSTVPDTRRFGAVPP